MADAWTLLVEELDTGRTGDFVFGGPSEYLRRFRVIVKIPYVTATQVCFSSGLPLPFSFYTNATGQIHDYSSLLVRITADQEHKDDWQSWIVNCHYSTEMPPGGRALVGAPWELASPQHHPELDEPIIEWDSETKMVPALKDLDGKPYVNSAGVPMTEMVEVSNPVLNYIRNQLVFNQVYIVNYSHVLNSSPFLGAPAEAAYLYPPKGPQMFRGPYSYFRVHYRIKFAALLPDGTYESWQPEKLDAGIHELTPIPGSTMIVVGGVPISLPELEPVPIMKRGIPISQPVMLDGKGKQAKPKWVKVPDASVGLPYVFPIAGMQVKIDPQPVYLKFRQLRTVDFNTILIRPI